MELDGDANSVPTYTLHHTGWLNHLSAVRSSLLSLEILSIGQTAAVLDTHITIQAQCKINFLHSELVLSTTYASGS